MNHDVNDSWKAQLNTFVLRDVWSDEVKGSSRPAKRRKRGRKWGKPLPRAVYGERKPLPAGPNISHEEIRRQVVAAKRAWMNYNGEYPNGTTMKGAKQI
jgi:hypothetical protein